MKNTKEKESGEDYSLVLFKILEKVNLYNYKRMEQKSFERTKEFLKEAQQHGCNTVHAYCRMLHMKKLQENHW